MSIELQCSIIEHKQFFDAKHSHYLKTSERIERFRRNVDSNKNWEPMYMSHCTVKSPVGLRGKGIGKVVDFPSKTKFCQYPKECKKPTTFKIS